MGTAGPKLGSGSGEFAVMAGGREGERGVSLTVKSVARTLFVSYVDLFVAFVIGRISFRKIGRGEQCVVFVVGGAVVVCSLSVRCGFGWHLRDDRARGSCWLCESAARKVAFHGLPFQAVLYRNEPSRGVREIVVVSVAFPSLGWSSLLSDTLSDRLTSLGSSLKLVVYPAVMVAFGNHSCSLPAHPAPSEDP